MKVPESIKIDGDRKDISWITDVTGDNDIRIKMLVAGLCKRVLTEKHVAVTKPEVSSICKALSKDLPQFLERYGKDFYTNLSQPLPKVIHLNSHVFKSRAGFENQCYFRNVDGVLFAACRAILEDAKIDPPFFRLLTACNFVSDLLHKVFTENAVELFGKKPTWDTEALMKSMEKNIADSQSDLHVLNKDFAELRKSLGELVQTIRLVSTTENENLVDQNAALKQKVKFLSDENRRLLSCIETMIRLN